MKTESEVKEILKKRGIEGEVLIVLNEDEKTIEVILDGTFQIKKSEKVKGFFGVGKSVKPPRRRSRW